MAGSLAPATQREELASIRSSFLPMRAKSALLAFRRLSRLLSQPRLSAAFFIYNGHKFGGGYPGAYGHLACIGGGDCPAPSFCLGAYPCLLRE